MLDGWQRLSFRANDIFIDRARAFCEKHVAQKFNDEYNCYPMEVYSQVVNGKNYKVLLLGKHFKTNEFKCFSSIMGSSHSKTTTRIQRNSFKAIDGTACALMPKK